MVIDFHTHTFPPKIAGPTVKKLAELGHITPFADAIAETLLSSMKTAGVTHSVLLPVATTPKQVVTINNDIFAQEAFYQENGLISFGSIHPDLPEWKEELSRIVDHGLKGIKIHPVYQSTDQDDPRYLRILERAGELDLIVVTHGGIDVDYPEERYCMPPKILNAVRQVGPVKLVAAHMGGWKCWDQAEELLADTQVYLDTSFSTGLLTSPDDHYTPEGLKLLDEPRFLRMVKSFGVERILFGTDSPWSDQKESIDWIQALPLSGEEKAAILGGNAQRLLKL